MMFKRPSSQKFERMASRMETRAEYEQKIQRLILDYLSAVV